MFHFFVAFYFFVIPFQWALAPLPGIDLALIRLFTLFIVLFWFLFSFLRKKIILPTAFPSFFLSGFLFLSSFSFVWAQNREFSLRKIIFLWSFLPLFFVLSSFFQESRDRTKKVFSFLLAGGFIVSLVALTQFSLQFILGVEKIFSIWTGQVLPFFLGATFGQAVSSYPSLLVNISGNTILRASGFFPDPHMFSLYIGMLIPLAVGRFFSENQALRRRYGFLVLTLVLADLLAFSRGGYLAIFAGLIFFFGVYFYSSTLNFKKIIVVTIFVPAVFFLLSLSPVASRFVSTFTLTDGSNSERVRLWKEAIEHIKERPLLGVGLGNYPLLVKPSAEYREPIYAHNLYLDIALEVGLIGLAFFVGLLLSVARIQWKLWKNQKNIFALSLLASLIVFAAHSFFESPIFSVHVLPAFLLILAGGV